MYESLLLCNVVEKTKPDNIRDVLLRKWVEMLLGNICRTEEITKIQMREMNSEKELGGILRNQKWKILQKMKDDPIKDRKKDNKKGFT